MQAAAARPLQFGEPAPWFSARCGTNASFNFDTMGGFWIVFMLFGSLAHAETQRAHDHILASRGLFDDRRAMFFGVTVDPGDHTVRRLCNQPPGLRYFQDYDQQVSSLYGVQRGEIYAPRVLLLDRSLRVVASRPIRETEAVLGLLAETLAVAEPAPADATDADAPVLLVPRIFEPELCDTLIKHFDAVGATPSGFMRAVDGKTVRFHDAAFKRRSDVDLKDTNLISAIQSRLASRLLPMVQRAYGYRPGYLERHLIACYTGEDSGFFKPHRDTTTPGTVHRQLAVTINLNADDYEGGELRFPEFGAKLYKPVTGGAAVFGGGLLHEVTPVTRGRRMAYLPFLYDETGAALRERNMHTIVDSVEG